MFILNEYKLQFYTEHSTGLFCYSFEEEKHNKTVNNVLISYLIIIKNHY